MKRAIGPWTSYRPYCQFTYDSNDDADDGDDDGDSDNDEDDNDEDDNGDRENFAFCRHLYNH